MTYQAGEYIIHKNGKRYRVYRVSEGEFWVDGQDRYWLFCMTRQRHLPRMTHAKYIVGKWTQ